MDQRLAYKIMTPNRMIIFLVILPVAVFFLAFSLSSGLFFDAARIAVNKTTTFVNRCFEQHLFSFRDNRDAHRYFLVSKSEYLQFNEARILPVGILFDVMVNIFLNSLFQPIILSVFTPQVVLNYFLFPFFLYGCIKYFKRVPVMIVVFLALSFYIGAYGSVIESLIRHRLSCELIYLLIGLAGFTGWITKSLS